MPKTVFFDNKTPPHIATLVLVAALGPLAMNIFLPSLPAISEYFSADKSVVQLVVTVYLFTTAPLQLLLGPLSDYFGRRAVVLVGIAIFFIGSAICLLAPTIEWLLAGRVLQAFAVVGLVIGRAAIRDMVDSDTAASMLGYVTMGMTLAPMLSPIIGGYLDEQFGWRATFWVIFGFGLVVLLFVWRDLGETHFHRADSLTGQVRAWPALVRSRRFWGYSLACAFSSGAFFALLGGAPYVATQFYGLSPSAFGAYFGVVGVGYMLGNYFSGRFSQRAGINRMMMIGCLASAIGVGLGVVLIWAGIVHPAGFFVPIILLGVGNGMTLPNGNAGMVSVRPHLAGAASGLGGFLQIGGGAFVSVLAGWVLGPDSHPYPLLFLMLTTSIIAVVATLYVIAVDRQLNALSAADAASAEASGPTP